MTNILLKDTQNFVTTLTMNRPEHLNALSVELREELGKTFTALKTDSATKVIILTGAGRAFTAGLDLKELGQTGMGTESSRRESTNVVKAMRNVGKPTIAAINGFAVTGGFEIALACDILIASTEARFADTHVRMGVVPGWGLSQRLARLIGSSRAKQLSFTGNYIDAEKACHWGLVNEVLSTEELLPYCRKIATDICTADPETLQDVHRLIDHGWEHSLAEGLLEEARISGASNQGIEATVLEENRKRVQSRGRGQLD